MNLSPFIDDLARRINETEEQRLHDAWHDFLFDRIVAGAFAPPRRTPHPPSIEWPDVHINDALGEIDLMVYQQIKGVSDELEAGGDKVLNVRSNYGVSIMASQLGCEVIQMPREHHNLPTAKALSDRNIASAVRAVIDQGPPDLRAGQGGDVFDCGQRFLEVFAHHELIRRWIHIYHPDAQGPIDNAELAWGSEIFVAIYDTPELLHEFLDFLTEHYISFLEAWFAEHPTQSDMNSHWGVMMRGNIMLRDDSLMNLSPEIYAEFIRDREARCLRELGGGGIHFCGRGSHVIDQLGAISGLSVVNMSQPHLNDMEVCFASTIDRGVKLISLEESAAAAALDHGRDLHGRVHVG